jgi:hypothetical protein
VSQRREPRARGEKRLHNGFASRTPSYNLSTASSYSHSFSPLQAHSWDMWGKVLRNAAGNGRGGNRRVGSSPRRSPKGEDGLRGGEGEAMVLLRGSYSLVDSTSVVRYCPHCDNVAPQLLRGAHAHAVKGTITYWLLGSCATCGKALLYVVDVPRGVASGGEGELFRKVTNRQLIWPPAPGLLSPSVPTPIRRTYLEASRIRTRSANGFANQIRRALELLCRDRGATGRNLAERLTNLTEKG